MNLIPTPKSKFLKVKCTECEHEMIVFNHAKTNINCQNTECNALIAEPQGGKALINAEILEIMDEN